MKKILTLILLCLGLFSLSYGADSLTTSLTAYYKLDNNVLTNSLSGFNIINGGTTNTTGKIISGRAFSGSSQHMNITSLSDTLEGNSLTFCAWLLFDALDTTRVIFSSGDAASAGYYSFYHDTTKLLLMPSDGVNYGTLNFGSDVPTNKYLHVCYVFNGSSGGGNSGRLKLYINGTQKTLTYTGTIANTLGTTGTNIYVGRRGTSASLFYSGKIDEMGFWKRSLNSSSINRLYNNNIGLSYPFTIPAPTFTAFKTQKGTFVTDSFFNTTTLNFNVTTDKTSNKKYWLYNYSNITINFLEQNIVYDADEYNSQYAGQTFKPTINANTYYNLSNILLRLKKTNSPTGTVTLQVKEWNGTNFIGSTLCSTTFSSSGISTITTEYNYSIACNNLNSSKTYGFSLSCPSGCDATNKLSLSFQSSDVYTKGSRLTSSDGITWGASSQDLYFKLNIKNAKIIGNLLVSSGLMTGSSFSSYKNLTLWDNKFKIYFNATNINGSSTSSNYTFTIDTTAPAITNALYVYPNGLYNYTINFSKFISITDANALTISNISLSNGQKVNISKRQTTTLTRNGNLSYNITAKDIAGNSNRVSGVLLVDPRLYNRIYSVPLSAYISNYTTYHYLNGVLRDTFTTPATYLTKRLYSDLGGNGVHTYVFSKYGYTTKNVSFTTNTSYSRNVTTNMLYSNINVRVYDALTKVLVNKNMTLKVYSDVGDFAKQYKFSSGVQTLTEFRSLPGTFRLELIGDGITYENSVSINQYATYLGLENLTINFYLYKITDVGDGGLSNIKVFEFKSISSDSKSYLSNIQIDIYKKDIVSNTTAYLLYDQKITSIDGSFNTILSSNDYYKYILTDLDTGVVQPEYLDQPLTALTTEIEWKKTVLNYNTTLVVDFNNIDYYYEFNDFYYDNYYNPNLTLSQLILAKNPAAINISFYYDDILDLMDGACLNVSYKLNNGGTHFINQTCMNGPQGIVVVHVSGRDLYRYPLVFYGYVYNNQTNTIYKMETVTLNLNIYSNNENIWGQGLVTANVIGVILALVFLFFGLAMHPVIGIMMYAFVMILLPFTTIAYKPIGAIGLIGILLAILFSYIGKKKRTQQGDP